MSNIEILNMKFNELYELQTRMRDLYRKVFEGGRVDYGLKDELDKMIIESHSQFDDLKNYLLDHSREHVDHLITGDINTGKLFTIYESNLFIVNNVSAKLVYKYIYNYKPDKH